MNSILDREGVDIWKHFINHPDSDISRIATDLLSEKYVESKRWSKAGAFMEKEEDILDVLILRIVAEYKFRKIRIMQDEIFKDVYKAFENNDEEWGGEYFLLYWCDKPHS